MDDKDRAAIEAGKAADEFAYRQNISRAYIGVRSLRDLLALAERTERAEAALAEAEKVQKVNNVTSRKCWDAEADD